MALEWTWIVDMAGDNNLSSETAADLAELASADEKSVGVVVQVDVTGKNTTRYVLQNKALRAHDLGKNVNAGSAQALTDFLTFAKGASQSQRHAVVLWGHGFGWLDFEGVTPPVTASTTVKKAAASVLLTHFNSIHKELLLTESVMLDASAHDFLTNQEMRDGLKNAIAKDGKFAIAGCDACLMSMIEVAYEIRDCAEVYVASQENEKHVGWPYDAILAQFK